MINVVAARAAVVILACGYLSPPAYEQLHFITHADFFFEAVTSMLSSYEEKDQSLHDQYVDSDIRKRIKNGESGVTVVVTLDLGLAESLMGDDRKKAIKEAQDKLREKISPGQFWIDHRFKTEPKLIGQLTADGLDILTKNPNVIRIARSSVDFSFFHELQRRSDNRVEVWGSLRESFQTDPVADIDQCAFPNVREHFRANYSHDELEVVFPFSSIENFTGFANVIGLERLADDPDVEVVVLAELVDIPLHIGW